MTTVHVLRVFAADDGGGGNPLGVVLDGAAVAPERRQEVAARLGFSETVFVDDLAAGTVRIFTPASELPFAGHPLVGTAWLLRREGHGATAIRPPAGTVDCWEEQGRSWIRARAAWVSAMHLQQFETPDEVDALEGAPEHVEFLYAWAWLDEERGVVRSRAFPRGLGIVEDEATGAAAVKLTAMLHRSLLIRQGRGSALHTRAGEGDVVELGGNVDLAELRELD